ncbi:MAG: hypothetical protein KDD47_09675 [Acidobacteria bacterium]|nr:hypothetical protein [Acidobacteriota bacterium]
MSIKVSASSQGFRGKDLSKNTRKFGTTRFTKVGIRAIGLDCQRIGKGQVCRCRLESIELDVCCEIRLNPKRIRGRFFDLRERKAVDKPGDTEAQRRRRPALDEQSVLVHESSHCDDVAEAVRKAVVAALGKNEALFRGQCLCSRRDLCLVQVRRLIEGRILGLARKAARDLSRTANRHRQRRAGEPKGTEEKARDAQAKDYRDNPNRERRLRLPTKKEKDRELRQATLELRQRLRPPAVRKPPLEPRSIAGPRSF